MITRIVIIEQLTLKCKNIFSQHKYLKISLIWTYDKYYWCILMQDNLFLKVNIFIIELCTQ